MEYSRPCDKLSANMRTAFLTAFLCGCSLLVGAQTTQPIPIPAPQAYAKPMPRPAAVPVVDNPFTPNYPTLVFDAETKQYDPQPGEMIAPFTFYLTNVWTNEIVIDHVKASCGCTTAKLPATPWHIPPGGSGEVGAQVNLAGKMGTFTKTLTFFTTVGNRIVTLKVTMPTAGADAALPTVDRKAAMAQAKGDPQAIFKADCAKCHVDKGARAFGQDLYAADCAICHESSHRDSVVPDLHALKIPTDRDYWKTMISFGKPHTMMPGFAKSQGGPLSDEQIASLSAYLDHAISHHFSSASSDSTPVSRQ